MGSLVEAGWALLDKEKVMWRSMAEPRWAGMSTPTSWTSPFFLAKSRFLDPALLHVSTAPRNQWGNLRTPKMTNPKTQTYGLK